MIIRSLRITDLLDDTIEIDGMDLTAHVCANFRKEPGQSIEVTDITVGDVFVQTNWGLVLLDQDNLKSRHKSNYEVFLAKCEDRAVQAAMNSEISEWDEEDVNPWERDRMDEV